ncbi:MAG: hypothetical protein ACR2KE_01850 [Candidatus Nanopelagicales bacterium]
MTANGSSPRSGELLRSLRTARSAAVGGLVFAVSIALVFYLYRSSFPTDDYLSPTAPLPSPETLDRVGLALNLIPYACIAFIWFMAALNYNIGYADHRLFTTVFLSSGIVLVGLLCVAGAVAGGEVSALAGGLQDTPGVRAMSGLTVSQLFMNYSARMAAVFCLSVSTFGRINRLLPTWLAVFGTLSGLVLLLVPFGVPYVAYVFPTWVAVLSIWLFIADPGGKWRAATARAD